MSVLKGVLCLFLRMPWVGLQCVGVVLLFILTFRLLCINHTSNTHIRPEKEVGKSLSDGADGATYVLGSMNIFAIFEGRGYYYTGLVFWVSF